MYIKVSQRMLSVYLPQVWLSDNDDPAESMPGLNGLTLRPDATRKRDPKSLRVRKRTLGLVVGVGPVAERMHRTELTAIAMAASARAQSTTSEDTGEGDLCWGGVLKQ